MMERPEESNILVVEGINKSFGGVHALDDVNLQIARGEIHCLAGENGSGKSTLIKLISGVYKPDSGKIIMDGKTYDSLTTQEAINAGVQVIYQDFSIFPNLSVIENIAFNQALRKKRRFVNKKEFREIAEHALSKINIEMDLDARMGELPVADKQLVAIARALLDDSRLLIMDEPTTALTRNEIDRLFDIVLKMQHSGVTVLFVSHKLNEVFEISNRITVLRNGKNVGTFHTSEMDDAKFTLAMTGRNLSNGTRSAVPEKTEIIMSIQNLCMHGSYENITFDLGKGEILGITGQLGSGRTELATTLFGLTKPDSGTISIDHTPVKKVAVPELLSLGVAYVPEDRLTEGLFLPQSITRNIVVTELDDLSGKSFVVNNKDLKEEAKKWIQCLSIAAHADENPVQTLSGGNQQKVVLARWLASKPRILILNGPTVGVDIGAKFDIHAILRQLAEEGMSIIVVSDDASELLAVCHRILVMRKGRMCKEIKQDEFSQEILAESML